MNNFELYIFIYQIHLWYSKDTKDVQCKESRALTRLSDAIAAFKGGGFKQALPTEIGRYPVQRAAYFFLR
ncbi:hypothetical protein [Paenibacillus sonchi]|uniref:hypothetical protein n=1 Tax=Paenibacillus sonchi TaxID=373687 RepID=UPI001E3A36CD|nr:hypothetical protein [Paenibacillus sonchi]